MRQVAWGLGVGAWLAGCSVSDPASVDDGDTADSEEAAVGDDEPTDTGDGDSGEAVEAWTPDPDQCFEEQLALVKPERIAVMDGTVMSCGERWLPDQHCYGVPEAPEDRFALEWRPWAHKYGFFPSGNKPADGMLTLDHELPSRGVLGPDNLCRWVDGTLYVGTPEVWEYSGWWSDIGNCTAPTIERCRCNDQGEPDDPWCLDVSVP